LHPYTHYEYTWWEGLSAISGAGGQTVDLWITLRPFQKGTSKKRSDAIGEMRRIPRGTAFFIGTDFRACFLARISGITRI
jgi:hypothetical protein